MAGKQLPTCSLWANDFLAAGVHPKCNTSVILTLDANPEAGAGYNVPTVGGVLVNYEVGCHETRVRVCLCVCVYVCVRALD